MLMVCVSSPDNFKFFMPLGSVKITQMHVLAPTGTAGEDGNRRASICKSLVEMENDQLE